VKMIDNRDGTITFLDEGTLCGIYHYADPFKSYFRGLYTPDGRDVVDPPPSDHPHHKGLQFGLCLSDANFWEEALSQEPQNRQIPIGRQLTRQIDALPDAEGVGFTQVIEWRADDIVSFHETRTIRLARMKDAYVWTWQSVLIASRNLEILTSVWSTPGYTGLGIRLAHTLFQHGRTVPQMASGATPSEIRYVGQGAEVTFQQPSNQANAVFLAYCGSPPGFAFMSLGPSNNHQVAMKQGERLESRYVIQVAVSQLAE
jgi:hypothetical protein